MRISKIIFSLILFLSFLLTGCSSGTNNAESVIASEKTLPSDFYEIAFQRETVPLFQYMIRRAVDQSQYEQTWDLYGFEGEMPSVDFDGKDVFFIGVQESGSCPYELKSIEWSADNSTMTFPLSEPGGDCTSDATPRTFVIQIDKEISKVIENVVIVESGIETNVPFEN
ncbi:MAG TPA: hypothetical protein VK945_08010 [Planococcus sp. (in: firmicutes)]|nr:hypothetical protein [Planococcus sp. (in: firmicutes)]